MGGKCFYLQDRSGTPLRLLFGIVGFHKNLPENRWFRTTLVTVLRNSSQKCSGSSHSLKCGNKARPGPHYPPLEIQDEGQDQPSLTHVTPGPGPGLEGLSTQTRSVNLSCATQALHTRPLPQVRTQPAEPCNEMFHTDSFSR